MTTLNTYGHMWPDADETARAAVAAGADGAGGLGIPTSCGLTAD